MAGGDGLKAGVQALVGLSHGSSLKLNRAKIQAVGADLAAHFVQVDRILPASCRAPVLNAARRLVEGPW